MEIFSEKAYWIWLSGIPGVGARRFHLLMERFGHPRAVWECSNQELMRYSNVLGEKIARKILEYKQSKHIETAAGILMDPQIFVFTLDDVEYPELLKTIYDPPSVLYCKGRPLRQDSLLLSIVGSRRTSEYGRQMAERIAFRLASAGIGIVSGAARGIDTMAHTGAIKGQGYTVAVLGSGTDIVYPRENKKLFMQIEQVGTIISEYPPGVQPISANFPARNRIISGMSKAVLVIEAGEKSGALITADFALEQGRDVYALPGNINNLYSVGTNRLLKEGARLITDAEEIIEEFKVARTPGNTKIGTSVAIQMDLLETQVYNALEDGEKYLEDLSDLTGIYIGRLNSILTMLELKGIVKQLPGKIFVKCI